MSEKTLIEKNTLIAEEVKKMVQKITPLLALRTSELEKMLLDQEQREPFKQLFKIFYELDREYLENIRLLAEYWRTHPTTTADMSAYRNGIFYEFKRILLLINDLKLIFYNLDTTLYWAENGKAEEEFPLRIDSECERFLYAGELRRKSINEILNL